MAVATETQVTLFNGKSPNLKKKNLVDDTENLVSLTVLNEPSIVHCLELRFEKNHIYTYCGPILIAVNPFQSIEEIYSMETLKKYFNYGVAKARGGSTTAIISPHVFAVADNAYRNMMRVLTLGSLDEKDFTNQSILISGESGSGKTETTKLLLRYLSTVASPALNSDANCSSVQYKVIESNPILESFGNARTIRNDNSSRFGKFVELSFNKSGHLIGGLIKTYLLEKMRLCLQQPGERNFHIFYEMATGGSPEEKRRWAIDSIAKFRFANRGNVFDLRFGDDASLFAALRGSLKTLEFKPHFITQIFDIVAAVLHFGQLEFDVATPGEGSVSNGEGSEFSSDPSTRTSLQSISSLLGLSILEITILLTKKSTITSVDNIESNLSVNQASDARDAVAKTIYSSLFTWIVSTINTSVKCDRALVVAETGVLDVFGFECFQFNSLEQLFINYTVSHISIYTCIHWL